MTTRELHKIMHRVARRHKLKKICGVWVTQDEAYDWAQVLPPVKKALSDLLGQLKLDMQA